TARRNTPAEADGLAAIVAGMAAATGDHGVILSADCGRFPAPVEDAASPWQISPYNDDQNSKVPLRSTSSRMRRPTRPCIRLSLPRLPEAHRECLCRASALAGRAGHGFGPNIDLGPGRRQWP